MAFSGKLTGKQIRHEEDGSVANSEVFNVDEAQELTESNMNEGLLNANLCTAFDRPALYMDKVIGNKVEVVQTFSCLNRITVDKNPIYIIDIANNPKWVLSCFKKYDL